MVPAPTAVQSAQALRRHHQVGQCRCWWGVRAVGEQKPTVQFPAPIRPHNYRQLLCGSLIKCSRPSCQPGSQVWLPQCGG